ncbi:MAG TPA: hypothetical protein VJ752_04885 [Burkholderiaceae bacterium]|nr:hypothetical protein [Burkholderiaceae bacterium]
MNFHGVLFRPRRIWLPTFWGCVVLLACAALLCVGLGRHAYAFLAPNSPAFEARTLVVEGWLDAADLDQAIAAFRSGRYERVLTTGGPIESWNDSTEWNNFADRAAVYLKRHGLTSVPVIPVPAPASAQDRSFLSAVVARDRLQAAGVRVDAIDLFSAGAHARRSWLVFRMAFGGEVRVGIMSARPATFDAQRWWTSSNGVKSVVGELLSLTWTKCCFWPGPRGSHEERWAVPPAAQRMAPPARSQATTSADVSDGSASPR